MITLLPADTFTVSNKTKINTYDDVLNMLYQPIIGSISLSLYYCLTSLLDKKEVISLSYTHHHLINIMKLKLPDILEAREKLEALGLLKTYVKKGDINNYVYEIYSPISANEFLNNPILNMLLFNTVGKSEMNRINSYFSVDNINLDDYKNVTRRFSEVFETVPYKSYELSIIGANKYTKSRIEIAKDIDFNLLISSVSNKVDKDKLFNNEIKELITNLAFVYDLDVLALEKIINASLNDRNCIDKERLRKFARNYYTFDHNGSLPNIIYKNQPESFKSVTADKSNFSKMIYLFDNTTPYDYLKSKQNGSNPTKRDLALIEELMVDYGLNAGVVNVLIDYVLKTNDNKLTKAYVETIAGSWKRFNIKTVIDAINLAKKEHKKYNKVTKVNPKVEDKVPDWFSEKATNTTITEEEKKDIDSLLEEFR